MRAQPRAHAARPSESPTPSRGSSPRLGAGARSLATVASALGLGLALGGAFGRTDAASVASPTGARPIDAAAMDTARDVSAAFERVSEESAPSVVRIECMARFGGSLVPSSQGSGVILDDRGIIATNAHVVRNSDSRTVILYDGRKFNAELVGVDVETDLAVLRIEAGDLVAAELRADEPARVGEWVLALGNPLGLGHTVTAGIISGRGRQQGQTIATYEDFIQTDAAINPGNSGGPLVDLQGRVIGINTAVVDTRRGGQGIGFAIPAEMIEDVVDQLQSTGRVTRGYIGVQLQRLSSGFVERRGYRGTSRVAVDSVVRDGPAEKAGLEAGDIIDSIDGRKVTSLEKLMASIARLRPGTVVQVAVVRDAQRRTIPVELTKRPPFETGR